ncbi:putative benzoate 4-monooxygenase cytochrome p450 protein [Botrytis fragariae]|uniref:Putative benzoate 4-monooxygenase cytochrome p450 protein n=1 Tax=Botrytis fragariae TaxID=1964551 RepID=A0A8H6B4Y1_9HELO|nr:putative benzoate 4-monooxygenase cytochrome p450 protein [Botrytis fragariae]KAF5879310.1 putative benzoate 4-monooxygenase cytochrome p450 protein [Botrytis fragariae]
MVKDKSGLSPFLTEHLSYIDKNLSLMQLRNVIATFMTRYDISFEPNEDDLAVCRDMKDQFNQHAGELDICFIPRAFK